MTVRFHVNTSDFVEVEYGDARTPVVGEAVVADGSDPEFPRGTYEVEHVAHHVTLHGPRLVVCTLSRVR